MPLDINEKKSIAYAKVKKLEEQLYSTQLDILIIKESLSKAEKEFSLLSLPISKNDGRIPSVKIEKCVEENGNSN